MYLITDAVEDTCKKNLFGFLNQVFDNYKTINMKIDEAVVMNLSWNNSQLRDYNDCSFRVKVLTSLGGYKLRNSGIYASIRKLKLRKNDVGQCYDHITLRYSTKDETNKICGMFDASPENIDKMPFFADENGEIIFKIKLDKYIPIKSIQEKLQLSIILTAYENCEKAEYHQIMCAPGHCISKLLENDGIVNCPPKFCLDEETCFTKPIAEEQLNHSNIALSALTSLIFTLFAVGLCLWVCWKYTSCKNMNTSMTSANSGNNGRNRNNAQRASEPEFQTIELPPVFDRTANSIDTSSPQPPPIDDKDLPPSYESLFSTPPILPISSSSPSGGGTSTVVVSSNLTSPSTAVNK